MSTQNEALQHTHTERTLLTQVEVERLKHETNGAHFSLEWLMLGTLFGCCFFILFYEFDHRAILKIMGGFLLARLFILMLQYHRFYTNIIREKVDLNWKSIVWVILYYVGAAWVAWKHPDRLFFWSFGLLWELIYVYTQLEDILSEFSRRARVKRIAHANSVFKVITTTTTTVCGKYHTPASELMLDAGPITQFEKWEIYLNNGATHEVSEEHYNTANPGDEYTYTSVRYIFK
ncbi:MAG: hypothetical protein HUU01_19865 [Saprospiraceae bacterium]|nr:hypothetical protein [Saprospiraceae bacterium]